MFDSLLFYLCAVMFVVGFPVMFIGPSIAHNNGDDPFLPILIGFTLIFIGGGGMGIFPL